MAVVALVSHAAAALLPSGACVSYLGYVKQGNYIQYESIKTNLQLMESID